MPPKTNREAALERLSLAVIALRKASGAREIKAAKETVSVAQKEFNEASRGANN